jgi:ANTAR domain
VPGNPPDPRARSPFVKEASKRGIFAYITDSDVEEWQSAIDIVLRRFAEYHDLEGAFGRRAVTKRAKGIPMERHSVDDADAFEMLRDQSRRANTKLADVAAAVVDGHRLLPKQPDVSRNRALVLLPPEIVASPGGRVRPAWPREFALQTGIFGGGFDAAGAGAWGVSVGGGVA